MLINRLTRTHIGGAAPFVELFDHLRFEVVIGCFDVILQTILESVDTSADALHDPCLKFLELRIDGGEVRVNGDELRVNRAKLRVNGAKLRVEVLP
jgi:hypothetical protein